MVRTPRTRIPSRRLQPHRGTQRRRLVRRLPRELGLVAAEVAVGGGLAVDRAQAGRASGRCPSAAGRNARSRVRRSSRRGSCRCPRCRRSRSSASRRRSRRRPAPGTAARCPRRRRSSRRSAPRRTADRSTFEGSLPENAPPPCGAAPPYVSTMILRPVSPASPCGPPISKRPVGFTRKRVSFSMCAGITGLMISSITASASLSCLSFIDGWCCVDSTTVSTRMGLAVDVADRHLRLRVGPQERQPAVAPHFALPLHQAVRVVDRKRHQRRRFVARVAEHEALVAGALVQIIVGRAIHALRDVGRLPAVADHHGATVGIEPQFRIVVADRADHLPRDAAIIDVGLGRDLAGHHDEPGRHQRLRRDPGRRVLL